MKLTWSKAVAPLLAASRQRPTLIHSIGFSCLLQEHPIPLQFGASSTETVGKLFLFLYIYFSCCSELLQPVSSEGSFAKCLPRACLGGLQWGFQLPQAPSRCPCHLPFPSPRLALGTGRGEHLLNLLPLRSSRWPGHVTAFLPEPVRGGLAQHLRTRLWALAAAA